MARLTRTTEALLDEFLWHARFERNLRPATIVAYEQDLRLFLEHLARNGRGSPGSAGRDEIVAFLQRRMDQGLAVRTRARNLSAIRRFYHYLLEEGKVTVDPCQLIESMRLPFHFPTVLTEEEVELLLEAPDVKSLEGLRDRALLEFMYASGVRVSELCHLDLDALYLRDGLVRVRGKGDKERLVPMTTPAVEWLESYLTRARSDLLSRASRSHPEARHRVFVSRRGKGLTRQGVWKLIGKYATQVGLRVDVHPHMLRHCFATHLLVHGADLRIVQALLGHADIGTTEIYTHLSRDDLRQSYRAHHPRGGAPPRQE